MYNSILMGLLAFGIFNTSCANGASIAETLLGDLPIEIEVIDQFAGAVHYEPPAPGHEPLQDHQVYNALSGSYTLTPAAAPDVLHAVEGIDAETRALHLSIQAQPFTVMDTLSEADKVSNITHIINTAKETIEGLLTGDEPPFDLCFINLSVALPHSIAPPRAREPAWTCLINQEIEGEASSVHIDGPGTERLFYLTADHFGEAVADAAPEEAAMDEVVAEEVTAD